MASEPKAKPTTTSKTLPCRDPLDHRCRHDRNLSMRLQSPSSTNCKSDQTHQTLRKTAQTTVPEHDVYSAIVKSLPGRALNTHARIIAALGDDRGRYGNAESLQAASGIAPLTTQSGRQSFVNARWACTKFMKQTFHEYAGLSIAQSRWAKAYYEQQKAKNESDRHAAQKAKRALAYKWQRIIYRCWQTGEPYNEARYIGRLQATGSPLYALIEAAE